MNPLDTDKFIPVFQPFDSMQAGLIRNALEQNDIVCYVDNENASSIRFGGLGMGAAAMTVMVPESQMDAARQIIADLGFQ